jgi:hypothetical protein
MECICTPSLMLVGLMLMTALPWSFCSVRLQAGWWTTLHGIARQTCSRRLALGTRTMAGTGLR